MAGTSGSSSSGASGSQGSTGSSSGSGASAGAAGGSSGSSGAGGGAYSGANDGAPNIPTGTGAGAGDLDEIFNKSLGDFDGSIEGERDVIASTGGGSAKAAGQREKGDADAVANGSGGGMTGDGAMADTGSGGGMSGGAMGGPAGSAGGMSGEQGGSQASGAGGQGGEGISGGEEQRAGGDVDADDGAVAVVLPDDIPVDGSGDDVVGRQIREAAIAMQESNPEAAEKLWDEYRKHTGIK
jgi:hypothetical protein